MMTPLFAIITSAEIIIVGAIIVLLFGAPQLPKLARAMGEAKREFEGSMRQPPAPGPPPAPPSTQADLPPAPQSPPQSENPPSQNRPPGAPPAPPTQP